MNRQIILAALAMMAAAAPASAATLVNGDFESPGGDVRTQIGDGSPAPLDGGGVLTGWDHAGGSFDIYESDDTGDGLVAANGTHYVSFGHNGTTGGSLSQSFDTIVGQTYTISYYVSEQQGDDPDQVLRATLTNGLQTLSEDNSALSLGFRLGVPITFTALDTSATISFLDATPMGGGGGSNLALDAVSVGGGAPAVPETATWAMMIGGFGLVGGAMRRRSGGVAVSCA